MLFASEAAGFLRAAAKKSEPIPSVPAQVQESASSVLSVWRPMSRRLASKPLLAVDISEVVPEVDQSV
jgi:hypothetical protein